MQTLYYVTSNNLEPEKLYFSLEAATASESKYIDVFNSEGKKVQSYMFVKYVGYTTDF